MNINAHFDIRDENKALNGGEGFPFFWTMAETHYRPFATKGTLFYFFRFGLRTHAHGVFRARFPPLRSGSRASLGHWRDARLFFIIVPSSQIYATATGDAVRSCTQTGERSE